MRRGTSFVEVLVIIAVVWVSVALALPTVQTARAAARKLSCTQNLKQIGSALHNYQSSNDVLPMGQVRGDGHGNGHSVFSTILPYLDQIPLYNCYNFDLENYDKSNLTVVRTQVSTLLCPDNSLVANLAAAEICFAVSHSSFARSHYGANWGGGHDRWGEAGTVEYRRRAIAEAPGETILRKTAAFISVS